MAIRLLNGAPPASIGVPRNAGLPFSTGANSKGGASPRAGYRQGVSCAIAPEPVERLQGTVLSAIGVLAIQSLLIIGLLYRRAHADGPKSRSRNNLALAADASRRLTMSALTSTIAHELGQPLSSMIHQRPSGSNDDHRRSVRRPTRWARSCRHRDRRRAGHTDHRSASDHAPRPSTGRETDRSPRRDR